MTNIKKILEILSYIVLIIFSLFIIYQIIRKILGGSWETQDILIAAVVLIIGFMFNITIKLTRLESNFNNLKSGFLHLAKDFKQSCVN